MVGTWLAYWSICLSLTGRLVVLLWAEAPQSPAVHTGTQVLSEMGKERRSSTMLNTPPCYVLTDQGKERRPNTMLNTSPCYVMTDQGKETTHNAEYITVLRVDRSRKIWELNHILTCLYDMAGPSLQTRFQSKNVFHMKL